MLDEAFDATRFLHLNDLLNVDKLRKGGNETTAHAPTLRIHMHTRVCKRVDTLRAG